MRFEMNGYLNESSDDWEKTGISTLWVNSDQWKIYRDGNLLVNSDDLKSEDICLIKDLACNKKFIKISSENTPTFLSVFFEDFEVRLDSSTDEVYDLLEFFLPDGSIYYYSSSLFKSAEIDAERDLSWRTILLEKLSNNYLKKLLILLHEHSERSEDFYVRFGITGNIKKTDLCREENSIIRVNPSIQIETDRTIVAAYTFSPNEKFNLREKGRFDIENLSRRYSINEIGESMNA